MAPGRWAVQGGCGSAQQARVATIWTTDAAKRVETCNGGVFEPSPGVKGIFGEEQTTFGETSRDFSELFPTLYKRSRQNLKGLDSSLERCQTSNVVDEKNK